MTMANGERTYQLNALTDLWTGSVTLEERNGQRKEITGRDRLITTGLLGSIRWWFEVLVRGLNGNACDPTDTKCEDRNHCVVCELFGCTGWARKFRFEVLDDRGNTKTYQIKGPNQNQVQGETFSLRFTPLRPIRDEEWALLDATLHLIACYGAIGGKTVFKPSDEHDRGKETHHQDYGIVQISSVYQKMNYAEVKNYVCDERWRKPQSETKDNDFSWASLKNFWCVKGRYLSRQDENTSTFNRVIGRPEPKGQSTKNDSWLAGSQQKSKKVFSFKSVHRTFGFVEKDDKAHWERLRNTLADLGQRNRSWDNFDPSKDFLTGNQILKKLFVSAG